VEYSVGTVTKCLWDVVNCNFRRYAIWL